MVDDVWDHLPEGLRQEFLASRTAADREAFDSHAGPDDSGWEPLRPVILRELAYRGLEALSTRVLELTVEACRRRASTVGELHRLLRFSNPLRLADPDWPLAADELTRYARPDILIEQGRPRFLELNSGTRLGGKNVVPELAEAYAGLCQDGGLRPPPSTVDARSAALARSFEAEAGRLGPGRVLVLGYRMIDITGTEVYRRHDPGDSPIIVAVRRAGLEVVRADLDDLRLGSSGQLLAGGAPIDVVLIEWGFGDRIVDDGGLAALRAARHAGTVRLFPCPESILLSSKVILAWLHEDCAAGLLAPADRALVRTHVPWTACLGLSQDSGAVATALEVAAAERDRLIVKPSTGKSGTGVLFGRQLSHDDWLSAIDSVAAKGPVVLQRRVESGHLAMPFYDRSRGQQVLAQVPFVLSPFIIDGAAASVAVRHPGPGVASGSVVISASLGAFANTALLTRDAVGSVDPLPQGSVL
ncbi:MAG TPA: hypothetical protein VI248_24585 [Kineosporiaceae bacterium]